MNKYQQIFGSAIRALSLKYVHILTIKTQKIFFAEVHFNKHVKNPPAVIVNKGVKKTVIGLRRFLCAYTNCMADDH